MLAPIKTLLTSIVDYAGLFPPATLSLPEALQQYTQHQESYDAWMLSRFVLPVSRLNEFATLLSKFSLKHCSLSLILSIDLGQAIVPQLSSQLNQIQSLSLPKISMRALEVPPIAPAEIEQILPHLPAGIETFFEIPLGENLKPYLAVLHDSGAAAKIRTGGITVDAFPATPQLGQFILSCAEAAVPFKATAGLHHPLPANYPLTAEPNSPVARMQGFLNVVLVSALVYHQKITRLEEALTLLQNPSIDNFQFTATDIFWQGYSLNLNEIGAARQHFFRSFGSCSFQEPVDALKELALL
ncbi:hypothetical protein K9N68_37770 (plasmid) [Kovacikia minuta CCNUW1]|uniref:hypothetical protein n=1 Tax=Kovacikia minuta TaxID=2931930 RepID=UPI001CCE1486|nr:hypothetical protein [Kovacikia minuta]UBF29958.1 hypothetical protein K9N68_37770 [Kovacikia minuta CCNUW1]